MRYAGMPAGMWALFRRSFRDKLVSVLGYSEKDAGRVMAAAKPEYRKIIGRLPEFEKSDRFKMNIVNCALFSAVLLNLPELPDVSQAADYYEQAMMTAPMKWFCRMAGKQKFSEKDVRGMKTTATLNAADRNPYSWNMEFLPYPDGSGYEARFSSCGICTLMKELRLSELIPAMCRLDYAMTEAGRTAEFVRDYTLASGGPYCDCGYRKK
ncbi:MAG: L-2-amino-thiazoline-4-carboxylic acid hydrolase [Firmicutes bacterium]|nr:L-2-amino-thiazoline-4-carboxylic acid hydrolase [Bacillota bacterium]